MKTVFRLIFMAGFMAGLTSSALAANPLTPAERSVCHNLSHCLSIVETHPFDSFDYNVLAREFARFGPRGQRALIKHVGKDGAEAGHAADLLAIMAEPDTLPSLKNLAVRSDLAARTVEAIAVKLRARSDQPGQTHISPHANPSCLILNAEGTENRRDQMPFFEARIAQADPYGAFRPSATFRYKTKDPRARQYKSRAWLRAAVPVTGGWIAAYPDALIHYDSRSGAPTLLAEKCVSGLFMKQLDQRQLSVWGLMDDNDQTTNILSITADIVSEIGDIGGPVTHAVRLRNGDLCLTSNSGDQVTLRPDGSIGMDCPLTDRAP